MSQEEKEIGPSSDAVKMPFSRMEFYRSTPVGTALVETLNEMVDEGSVSKEDAWTILESYDDTIQESIRDNVSLKPSITFNKAFGILENFNHIKNLWKVEASDVSLQVGKAVKTSDRVMILCMHET